MKITILKENLKNGLKVVSCLINRNLTLPILNNILISVEKNFLNLAATDLELGIKYWSLIKTEKEGKIAVPTRIFSDLINFLPAEKITLEVKNQILYIENENYQTKIKGLPADDFPIIPQIENKEFVELNAKVFCQGLSQVVDFTAANQNRLELSGVYFNFQKNRLCLTATDSFRLAERVLFFEEKNSKEYSFILPQRTAREIINIFSENKEKIRFYFSASQVLFESLIPEFDQPQIQVTSRLIEGEYPDYQEIIPQKYQAQIVLPKDEFLNQIKTASVFSGKTNEVKIKVDSLKDGVEIFAQNPESGESRGFLPAKINWQTDPDSIGDPRQGRDSPKTSEIVFNHRFLTEGLLNIKSPRVIFELNNEDGPAVLRPDGDPSYVYVVMPVKAV